MSNSIEDSSDKRSIRDENEWKTIEDVGEPISNGDNMYTGHYTFKGLRPRSNYVVMVSSENQYGWSRPSNSSYMFFGTKGARKTWKQYQICNHLEVYFTSINYMFNISHIYYLILVPLLPGGASSLQFRLTTIIISILSISLYSRNFQLAFSSWSYRHSFVYIREKMWKNIWVWSHIHKWNILVFVSFLNSKQSSLKDIVYISNTFWKMQVIQNHEDY